jgi:hypothetical protein
MNSPTEAFKVNLNQNLWGLLISFGFLGAAEHYDLHTLFWFAVFTSVFMTVSVLATTITYTMNYCRKKDDREH